MSDNEALRRELEQYISHYHATNTEDVTDAAVVSADDGGTDEDTLLQQLTQAVNPQYLGDDGTHPTTKGSPPSMGLNWGPDGDDELTRWFNQGT